MVEREGLINIEGRRVNFPWQTKPNAAAVACRYHILFGRVGRRRRLRYLLDSFWCGRTDSNTKNVVLLYRK